MDNPATITHGSVQRSTCMHCGYDLRGLGSERCPECGKTFDAALFRRRVRNRRLLSLAIMAFAIYAPFGWLFFVRDSPEYVRSWVITWPILPGLVPAQLLALLTTAAPIQGPAMYALMTIITLAGLIGFTWLGSRSRRALILWALVALALSSLNSFIALQLFKA
jgi:hypothetical protein